MRSLPDAFLADPATPPSAVASLIGIEGDLEIYEITVATIGYFSDKLGDFVNPRVPPQPGDPVYIASSQTLTEMLSPRTAAQTGSAHIAALDPRNGRRAVVLSVRNFVSNILPFSPRPGRQIIHRGVLV